MDQAGRVVIPEEIRHQLSLRPGSQLQIATDGDGIRLTPVERPSRVLVRHDGLPMIERVDGSTITDVDVQRWRDADQR